MAAAHRTTARDFTGFRTGRLTAIESTARRSGNNVVWRCLCDCGRETFVHSGNLADGTTKSCGCWKRDRGFKHGATTHRTATPEYSAWAAMHRRCENPNNPRYKHYGARGIQVCERWKDFAPFLADMGPRPDGFTLERVDRTGNYDPANCQWASYAVQNRNTSRNRFLTWNGERMCLRDWCTQLGLPRHVFYRRLRAGWSIEQALRTPLKHEAPLQAKPSESN